MIKSLGLGKNGGLQRFRFSNLGKIFFFSGAKTPRTPPGIFFCAQAQRPPPVVLFFFFNQTLKIPKPEQLFFSVEKKLAKRVGSKWRTKPTPHTSRGFSSYKHAGWEPQKKKKKKVPHTLSPPPPRPPFGRCEICFFWFCGKTILFTGNKWCPPTGFSKFFCVGLGFVRRTQQEQKSFCPKMIPGKKQSVPPGWGGGGGPPGFGFFFFFFFFLFLQVFEGYPSSYGGSAATKTNPGLFPSVFFFFWGSPRGSRAKKINRLPYPKTPLQTTPGNRLTTANLENIFFSLGGGRRGVQRGKRPRVPVQKSFLSGNKFDK